MRSLSRAAASRTGSRPRRSTDLLPHHTDPPALPRPEIACADAHLRPATSGRGLNAMTDVPDPIDSLGPRQARIITDHPYDPGGDWWQPLLGDGSSRLDQGEAHPALEQALEGFPPEDILSINYFVEPLIWPFWRRNSALITYVRRASSSWQDHLELCASPAVGAESRRAIPPNPPKRRVLSASETHSRNPVLRTPNRASSATQSPSTPVRFRSSPCRSAGKT